jgi:hypothetical protein
MFAFKRVSIASCLVGLLISLAACQATGEAPSGSQSAQAAQFPPAPPDDRLIDDCAHDIAKNSQ